jgi:antitoxin component of MazEF toxin-antitoxin module
MSEALTKSSKVAQWGNSAAVRLAAATLETAHLRINDAVEVIAREDEIIIRRQRPRVTMAELLARFDPAKHRHDLQLDVEPLGTETPSELR